jgi:hypothetical protein
MVHSSLEETNSSDSDDDDDDDDSTKNTISHNNNNDDENEPLSHNHHQHYPNHYDDVDESNNLHPHPDQEEPTETILDLSSASSSSSSTFLNSPPPKNNDSNVVINNNQRKRKKKQFFSPVVQRRYEYWKCICLGSGMGLFAILPVTFLHYFVYQPTYTSIAQWEFDTYTGALQGALLAVVYYSSYADSNTNTTTTTTTTTNILSPQPSSSSSSPLPESSKGASPNTVLLVDWSTSSRNFLRWSFVMVRTLSRIQVPMRCTAFPLYCTFSFLVGVVERMTYIFFVWRVFFGVQRRPNKKKTHPFVPYTSFPVCTKGGDFFGFASWSMVTDFMINYAESAVLFGTVASVMDTALQNQWIQPVPVHEEED